MISILCERSTALAFLQYIEDEQLKFFRFYAFEIKARPFVTIAKNPQVASAVKIQRWWLAHFSRPSLYISYQYRHRLDLKVAPLTVMTANNKDDLKVFIVGLKKWQAINETHKPVSGSAQEGSCKLAEWMISAYESDQLEEYDWHDRLTKSHIFYLIDRQGQVQAFCRSTFDNKSWHIIYLATAPQNTQDSVVKGKAHSGCGSTLLCEILLLSALVRTKIALTLNCFQDGLPIYKKMGFVRDERGKETDLILTGKPTLSFIKKYGGRVLFSPSRSIKGAYGDPLLPKPS